MATEEANATTTRTSSRPSFDERIINNCSRQGEEDADEQREDEAVTMISRSNKYRKICHSSRDDADDEENPNTLRQKRSRSSNAARANPSMGTTGTATGTTMMSSSTSSSASSSFSSRETPSTNSSTKRNSSDKKVGLPYRYSSVFTELAPLDHYPKLAQMNKQRQRFQETVDTEQLSDDVLGKCLFSGYLDTLEVLKLSTVSKRIQSIAKDKVKMLDLHNLPMLTPTNVATLVSNFPNVTVRIISLSSACDRLVLWDGKECWHSPCIIASCFLDAIRYVLTGPELFILSTICGTSFGGTITSFGQSQILEVAWYGYCRRSFSRISFHVMSVISPTESHQASKETRTSITTASPSQASIGMY